MENTSLTAPLVWLRAAPRTAARLLALCAALFVTPHGVRADGTITLVLPPSRAAVAARARVAAAKDVARTSVEPRDAYAADRSTYASRHMAARSAPRQERPVGQLGLLQRPAPIYRSPSPYSRRLVDAQAGTYLAIQDNREGWLGVLMADGSTGWLRSDAVQLLDYQVVSTGAAPANPAADAADQFRRTGVPFFTGDGSALLAIAYRYLGVPYVWGGNTARGIDCSGFVKKVFAACGYELPRLGSDQMAYGVPVPPDQLEPGDRLYFGRKRDGSGVTHTGIYVGAGYFIHSSSSRRGVAVSSLSEPLYRRIYVCARR